MRQGIGKGKEDREKGRIRRKEKRREAGKETGKVANCRKKERTQKGKKGRRGSKGKERGRQGREEGSTRNRGERKYMQGGIDKWRRERRQKEEGH